jgi:hypothetical protein
MWKAGRGTARGIAAGIALALAAAAAGVGNAGDAEMARFLLQGARDDVAKKAYDDALVKLDKASKEDPGLIEVAYWVGQAQEGKKNSRSAIAAYRAYRAAHEAKRGDAPTSKEEDAILSKANARLAAIAPAESELERIRAGFTASLYSLAEQNFVRDPAVAKRALKTALDVDAKHAAAVRLYERLGGSLATPEVDDTGIAVKTWIDYVKGRKIKAEGIITFEGDAMILDAHVGKICQSPEEPTGKRYVVDFEFRFLENRDPVKRTVGLIVGGSADFVLALMMDDREVELVAIATREGSTTPVGKGLLKEGFPVGAWRRIHVAVDGTRVVVRGQGQPLIEATVEDRDDLSGNLGLYVQECRAEVRRLRLGRPD